MPAKQRARSDQAASAVRVPAGAHALAITESLSVAIGYALSTTDALTIGQSITYTEPLSDAHTISHSNSWGRPAHRA